jgi:hypothetical protein
MKVQNQPGYLPRALNNQPPAGPEQPQPPNKDKYAAYNEADADKHRVSYETAYNLSRGVAYAVEGGARIGQTMALGSSLLGLTPGSLATGVGLVGGTIDVARGASGAMQSAMNREARGAVLGGLQVAQGVATWVSVGATIAGAPGVVSQVAAGAALAALAGRVGVSAYAKVAPKPTKSETPLDRPQVSVELDPKAKPHGEGRLLENSFAMAKAINDAASNLGGMGAGWNNVRAVFTGNAPDGIWAPLGVVGSTYTILTSASQIARSASNQHLEDTLGGTIGLIQGGASMAVSLGVGGRLLGGVAVGAFLVKSALPMLQLKKRLSGAEEEGQKGMMDRFKENISYAFSGKPAESEAPNNDLFKSEDKPPTDETPKDAEQPPEPKDDGKN